MGKIQQKWNIFTYDYMSIEEVFVFIEGISVKIGIYKDIG